MGSTVGDWNMDGLLDVLFTSISISKTDLEKLSSVSTNAGMLLNFRGNHLYQNVGGRRFEDKTDAAKVRESGWGWGSFFFDMDNDGDMDLVVFNYGQANQLLINDWPVTFRIPFTLRTLPGGSTNTNDTTTMVSTT